MIYARFKKAYYDPKTGLEHAEEFYRRNKDIIASLSDVKKFTNAQEVKQLHKIPNRYQRRHWYPITAKYPFENMQIDLCDMSDVKTVNNNVAYLLTVVDIFTRKAFVFPLKTKSTNAIINAFHELFSEVIPKEVTCDNGSEFISSSFKKLMGDNNVKITYVNINDHNRLGVVDRFIQTLRNKINRYMTAYNTSKYIAVLNDIVDNYNNSYNSGIKSVPNDPDIKGIKQEFIKKWSMQ